ncbi:MAG: thioredoxin family protein [Armatimonadetes bacterium]|nr:thioredoxin family protein [Armatimonadota bacterium]
MSTTWRIFIVIALIALVVGAVAVKSRHSEKVGAPKKETTVVKINSDSSPEPQLPKSKLEAVNQPSQTKPEVDVSAEKNDAKLAESSKANAQAKTSEKSEQTKQVQTITQTKSSMQSKPNQPSTKHLPKLVDIGSEQCIPCKMMISVLDELSKEYKGKLEVVFIDLQKNPEAAEKFGVKLIPTQVFYDEKGKEFFRHTGFYPKEEIIARFKEHGIKL